jgi:hypothetical protein
MLFWSNNPIVGFEVKGGLQNVDEFGEAEEEILAFMDVEFLDEVGDRVE